MLTHDQIWFAIDSLAERHGLSASALAKRAGLDATTFNRSKRKLADGHPRWPSTESIAKILAATGTGVDEFLGLIPQRAVGVSATVPCRTTTADAMAGFDADGIPHGSGWDHIATPGLDIAGFFAIAIDDDAGLPLYRSGDTLFAASTVELRAGDRVALVDQNHAITLAVLLRVTTESITVTTLAGGEARTLPRRQLRTVARILWASQ